jgi:hypothetical protein
MINQRAFASCRAPLVFSLALASCVQAREPETTVPIDSNPSVAVFRLSPEALESYSSQALNGNLKASYCVAMYYAFVESTNPLSEFWIAIGAENGDTTAMQAYATILRSKRTERESVRAAYWIRRARESKQPEPAYDCKSSVGR